MFKHLWEIWMYERYTEYVKVYKIFKEQYLLEYLVDETNLCLS